MLFYMVGFEFLILHPPPKKKGSLVATERHCIASRALNYPPGTRSAVSKTTSGTLLEQNKAFSFTPLPSRQ